MDDDGYRVYVIALPPNVHGAIMEDPDGFASIYINDSLSPSARRRTLAHELRHWRRGDLYNDMSIREVES